MSAAASPRRHVPPKRTRAERNEATRQRLFAAAAVVVGRHGYAGASVARIAAKAGVAQGTFYNYFANRQELLDELLPEIGADMLRFIGEHTRHDVSAAEKEKERFGAFFAFLREVPEFLRILVEAELFAPAGYRRHVDTVVSGYTRALKRARDRGEIAGFSDEELEALVFMLLGAREYLCRRYAYERRRVTEVPPAVVSAYEKLLRGELFNERNKEI
jgi:AcrR family transcriptional regulator